MLFKSYLIDLILQGKKTQTRRRGAQRYKPGHVYRCQRHYYDKTGPRIRIKRVWQQMLGDMTEEEARAEGFDTKVGFADAWYDINGVYRASEEVWAYEFELVRDLFEQEAV